MTLSVILAIISLGIGFLIGNFYKKRSDRNLKAELKNLEKEHKNLSKVGKKNLKDADKAKKQAESWKQKFEALNSASEAEISNLKSKQVAAEAELKDLREAKIKLESGQKILENEKVRLQAKFENLDNRYKTDLEDLKEWRTDKNKFNSHLKDYKSKLKVAEEKLAKLTVLTEKQSKEIISINEFAGKIRVLKSKNKQATEDLKYWEEKHYDTHHELTKYKKTYGEIYYKHEDLKKELEASYQANKDMEDKVQEYKTRFVKINQEYHQLIEKTGAFGKS